LCGGNRVDAAFTCNFHPIRMTSALLPAHPVLSRYRRLKSINGHVPAAK
jgi:hypothetical protein